MTIDWSSRRIWMPDMLLRPRAGQKLASKGVCQSTAQGVTTLWRPIPSSSPFCSYLGHGPSWATYSDSFRKGLGLMLELAPPVFKVAPEFCLALKDRTSPWTKGLNSHKI